MKKLQMLVLVVGVLLFTGCASKTVNRPDNVGGEKNTSVLETKDIISKIRSKGPSPVIVSVQIDESIKTGANLSLEEEKIMTDSISSAVEEILKGMDKDDYSNVKKYKYTPVFGITVNEKALIYLSNHSLVKGIEEDVLLRSN